MGEWVVGCARACVRALILCLITILIISQGLRKLYFNRNIKKIYGFSVSVTQNTGGRFSRFLMVFLELLPEIGSRAHR